MAEVTLVNCQGRYARIRREHLGLGYLKSYLASLQMTCEVVDGQFEGLAPEEVATRILAGNPPLAGFSIFFSNVGPALETVRLLRGAGYRGHICLGGHYATFQYKGLLERNAGVDSIVLGEGELTLAELLDRVRRGASWQDVPGLALRDRQGQPRLTPARPLIPNLDGLPFPDRSPYLKRMQASGMADITSSRGCYARCCFCSVNAFYRLGEGPRWRPRSAASVVD